jgi:hypothetical protein
MRSRERAVLTFSCAKAVSASSPAARIGACIGVVITLSFTAWNSARADGMGMGGCVGAAGEFNCVVRWGDAQDPYVRDVPQPVGEEEKALAAQRDRKWMEHCRPIISQDRYGVARYHYVAPGCEFGVLE